MLNKFVSYLDLCPLLFLCSGGAPWLFFCENKTNRRVRYILSSGGSKRHENFPENRGRYREGAIHSGVFLASYTGSMVLRVSCGRNNLQSLLDTTPPKRVPVLWDGPAPAPSKCLNLHLGE